MTPTAPGGDRRASQPVKSRRARTKMTEKTIIQIDKFIYPVDPLNHAIEVCPQLTKQAIEKIFKPQEVEIMEFTSTSDKPLPSYYYGRMQPTANAKGRGKPTSKGLHDDGS